MRKSLGACAIAAKEEFEEYEDWDDHYIMEEESDFVMLKEASYV